MNSWPPTDLYVRWTQVGIFTSHLRYHGAQPREPYEYPQAAPIVRQWLNLRYALIPYLADQAKIVIRTGLPIFRSLVFHHEDDPFCWHIDDQFYCGDAFLVAPVLNSEGVRDVYLPKGEWVDFWSGEAIKGPKLLRAIKSPLTRIPVYAVKGARIRVYPEPVQCTDEMKPDRAVRLVFDKNYRGVSASVLGRTTGL
jgi:alpha-D-xyloside xylohydrolase